jgi:hypothetical protein
MINELQTTALGCISAGARYGRFWRKADVRKASYQQASAVSMEERLAPRKNDIEIRTR